MSMSIDLYEFQEELVKSPDDKALDWVLENAESKAAYIVTVGKDGMPDELAEAIRAHGYEDGDAVVVVVQ